MPYKIGSTQKLLYSGILPVGQEYVRIALAGRQPSIYVAFQPGNNPSIVRNFSAYQTQDLARNLYYQVRVLDSIVCQDGYIKTPLSSLFIDEPACYVLALNGWAGVDETPSIASGELRLWYPQGVFAAVYCNSVVWGPG